MSGRTRRSIVCDCCHEFVTGSYEDQTFNEIREILHARGWTTEAPAGIDRCPQCQDCAS